MLEKTTPGGVLHFYAVSERTVVNIIVFYYRFASIQVVKDGDAAIAMAAKRDYGLGANIFTRSIKNTMKAMHEIKAGTFWINDPLTDNDAAPFGGMRKSGLGRELGEEGLDAFRETKHVHLDYYGDKKYYWFPNKTRENEIPK